MTWLPTEAEAPFTAVTVSGSPSGSLSVPTPLFDSTLPLTALSSFVEIASATAVGATLSVKIWSLNCACSTDSSVSVPLTPPFRCSIFQRPSALS